jgi:hypothetical protein
LAINVDLFPTFPKYLGLKIMAKFPTFPDCFDEVKTITTGCLRRLGYLRSGVIVRHASLHWSRGGKPSGSINLDVNADDHYLDLRYNVKGPQDVLARPIEFRVSLESRISNLGKGTVWYFICPATGKRCRTLYGIGDYFLSRSAYPSAMYSSQTEGKQWRELSKAFRVLNLEREHLEKRHSRTTYKGRLTRRYTRILDKQARIDPSVIQRFLNRG